MEITVLFLRMVFSFFPQSVVFAREKVSLLACSLDAEAVAVEDALSIILET